MTTPGSETLGKRVDALDIAQRLLVFVEDHFAAAGVDLPERRYLVAGQPAQVAWDCEQLTVGMAGIGLGSVPDQISPSPKTGIQVSVAEVRHAALIVEIVRCTPSVSTDRRGTPVLPSPEAIDAAGQSMMIDAGLLSQAMVRFSAHVAKDLSAYSGRSQVGAVTPQGPEGGYHSVVADFYLTVGNLV